MISGINLEIVKYQLLTSTNANTLSAAVNDSLKQGWVLYGPSISEGSGHFVQALVKVKERQ